MGEVVSIAKARQTDVFSMFDAACPSLPEETDRGVLETARRSVGDGKSIKPTRFRTSCLIIGAISFAGIALSFIVGTNVERRTIVGREIATRGDVAFASKSADATMQVYQHSDNSNLPNDDAFSSDLVVSDEFTLDYLQADNPRWRQSRESWLAHIAALERNPFYLKVVREKRLFSMTHPDRSE